MKKRNTAIELLRIISIVLIVLSHYVVHSEFDIKSLPVGINRFILEICTLGNVGTIIFVLISGYFLINSHEVKVRKIFDFWFQVFFYSFGIYLILLVLGKQSFSIKELMLNFFPITFKRYWFATVYFIIYLFHPFINKFIESLSRKEYDRYLILSVLIFFAMRTFTTMDYYGNEIIYFLIVYSIGAYFRKYRDNYFYKKNNSLKLIIISFALIVASIISMDLFGSKVSYLGEHSTYFLNIYSILTLVFSVSMFVHFSKIKEFENKFINNISSLVFGVYLISDNKYVRKIIWVELLKNKLYFSSKLLIIHILASILFVSIICLIIEWIRKKTFHRVVNKILSKPIEKIDKFINKERIKKEY